MGAAYTAAMFAPAPSAAADLLLLPSALLDALSDPVLVIGPDARLERLNRAALRRLALEPGTALAELMKLLSEKHGRVVILVDEYDKPILDTLFDLERAETFRTTLRGFYTQIKANDEYTRFVFMTGITKFTKTGVFSAMNNLRDISINDDLKTLYKQACIEFLTLISMSFEE